MAYIGLINLALIVVNIVMSYKGLKDHSFFDRYSFQVDNILVYKDYKRLVTSGFLHVSWIHLLFNMFALYAFSTSLELRMGPSSFLTLYFASLVGGNLLSLLIHRNHGDYSAVGASGAVCGIIFASIALFPGMRIGFFGLPFSIPAWIYGLLYVLYSIYGIRSKKDNIGHEAHLGGALIGMLVAVCIVPEAIRENYPTILSILFPGALAVYLIITRPQLLLVDNQYFKTHIGDYDIDDRYNLGRMDRQQEIDFLLEKIHKKGIKSLTKKERDTLEKYSQSV
ncbi:rhomboid family intramembrane serine protease [Chitinophaga ginsengisoli]|uniref:Membrane associated rhomboid family serine protease n=1 Tax=Chitinophaga ginsengisoli TaxID=363837 RepID=A0A2P8FUP5_9BACT|nr:rhomboid family intramembrane serine protease [Chitinophaga ginsengisoli]PSL25443.1 membrane associated rhomboid family serine protease [Chitinophaga ginsengisoli]